MKKIVFNISPEMQDKMVAAARRKAEIANKMPRKTNRVHKDKKNDYNRREMKKVLIEDWKKSFR